MYLKRVELKGFKSFADKTQIDLYGGITCVVGPNGSGKSNITDAVRWVLGEQRVKSLRGSKMEDVIFSGTKKRKPLGAAEVRLIFDNSDGVFPIEYSEVVIARRLFRSGEGEYLINNRPVRLKDVRDLISDTGIGKEGYSIIGQGRIEEILSSSREERRLLFEEATGITKFKYKKSEAERRLEAAESNLEGLSIRLAEIGSRLDPLRSEAARAERHIELSAVLRAAELREYARRYRRQQGERTKNEDMLRQNAEGMRELEEGYEAVLGRQRDASERKQILSQTRKQLGEAEFTLYRELEKSRSDHLLQKERAAAAGERLETMRRRETEHESGEETFQKQIRELDERITRERAAAAETEREIESVRSDQSDLSEELVQLRQDASDLQNEAIRILNEAESKKRYIEQNERAIESLRNKQISVLSTIDEELKSREQIESELAELERELRDKRRVLAESAQARERDEASLKKTTEQIRSCEEAYRELNRERLDRSAELELNLRLEEEFSGYDRGVREVVRSGAPGIVDAVGNLFRGDEAHETALEVALGRNIGVVVCAANSDARREIARLRKGGIGRVSFLSHEEIARSNRVGRPRTIDRERPGLLGFADELIRFDEKHRAVFEYLLGSTLVVETIDDGLKMLGFGYRIVTLEGDVLNPGGLITGGSYQKRSGILSRKRVIRDLTRAVHDLSEQIRTTESMREAAAASRDRLTARIAGREEEHAALRREETELSYRENKLRASLEEVLSASRQKSETAESCEAEIRQYSEESARFQARIASIETRNSELERENRLLIGTIGELESRDAGLLQSITDLRVDHAKRRELLMSLERDRARIAGEADKFRRLARERQSELEAAERAVKEARGRLEALAAAEEKLDRDYGAAREKREATEREESELQREEERLRGEEHQSRNRLDAARSEQFSLENRRVRIESELESIVAELTAIHGATVDEALSVEGGELGLAELRRLKTELAELGEVNRAAIAEYREVREKFDFLSAEKQDVESAIEQIRGLIRRLASEMSSRFSEGFEVIRSNFVRAFQKLFSGGEADLMIVSEESAPNVLEDPIEIFAQPPGKKLQSMSLLSGGEKSLTAIALLFAILESRPSPFCILDEIEAALDDVNISRFTNFLRSYSDRSQFVVITHRKGTMEIADKLYGVTMEEYGVSKLISVKLEDAAR